MRAAPQVSGIPANPRPLRFAHRCVNLVLRTNDVQVHAFARAAFEPVLDVGSRVYDHYAYLRAASDRVDVSVDGERLFEALVPRREDGKTVATFYAVRDVFSHCTAVAQPFTVYAAALNVRGNGVVLVGPSGAGKTLLSIHLAALGAELLGDEIASISRDEMLDALPRALMIRESSLPLLPYAAASAVRKCNSPVLGPPGNRVFCAVPAQTCGVSEALLPVPLRAVVVLDPEAPGFIRPLSSAAAALVLSRFRYRRSRPPGSDGFDAMSAFRNVRAFRAGRAHPAAIARHLDQVLRCL